MGYLALFGAGQLALGMVMFTTGARMIPAAEAALLSTLETILGPIWVWIIFAENPGERTILGGLVVLAALVVHTLLDLRNAQKPVPPPA
jgi:drug/metabolite transporter (DMT)-like permease